MYVARFTHQAPVVQSVDSAIHRTNRYPGDNAIGFPNTYPLDSAIQRLNNPGQEWRACSQATCRGISSLKKLVNPLVNRHSSNAGQKSPGHACFARRFAFSCSTWERQLKKEINQRMLQHGLGSF